MPSDSLRLGNVFSNDSQKKSKSKVGSKQKVLAKYLNENIHPRAVSVREVVRSRKT